MFYIFFGIGPISFWLLGNLEYRYPPLNTSEIANKTKTIVVLAGHAEKNPDIPISSAVNSSSAFRIIEAIRIYREFPDAEILISGKKNVPIIMKNLANAQGVELNNIMIENKSNNTYESALNLKKILLEKPFILVTSAGHMPRAMGVFQKLDMHPIPAPTDYMTRKNYLAISYLPSPLHLRYSDLAVHEHLGILWYRLKDRM
ncbi:MAG: YdcF family protein [Desulfobacula sp.]|nr:YdcF family protein [Desulfobacula sp.]